MIPFNGGGGGSGARRSLSSSPRPPASSPLGITPSPTSNFASNDTSCPFVEGDTSAGGGGLREGDGDWTLIGMRIGSGDLHLAST